MSASRHEAQRANLARVNNALTQEQLFYDDWATGVLSKHRATEYAAVDSQRDEVVAHHAHFTRVCESKGWDTKYTPLHKIIQQAREFRYSVPILNLAVREWEQYRQICYTAYSRNGKWWERMQPGYFEHIMQTVKLDVLFDGRKNPVWSLVPEGEQSHFGVLSSTAGRGVSSTEHRQAVRNHGEAATRVDNEVASITAATRAILQKCKGDAAAFIEQWVENTAYGTAEQSLVVLSDKVTTATREFADDNGCRNTPVVIDSKFATHIQNKCIEWRKLVSEALTLDDLYTLLVESKQLMEKLRTEYRQKVSSHLSDEAIQTKVSRYFEYSDAAYVHAWTERLAQCSLQFTSTLAELEVPSSAASFALALTETKAMWTTRYTAYQKDCSDKEHEAAALRGPVTEWRRKWYSSCLILDVTCFSYSFIVNALSVVDAAIEDRRGREGDDDEDEHEQVRLDQTQSSILKLLDAKVDSTAASASAQATRYETSLNERCKTRVKPIHDRILHEWQTMKDSIAFIKRSLAQLRDTMHEHARSQFVGSGVNDALFAKPRVLMADHRATASRCETWLRQSSTYLLRLADKPLYRELSEQLRASHNAVANVKNVTAERTLAWYVKRWTPIMRLVALTTFISHMQY